MEMPQISLLRAYLQFHKSLGSTRMAVLARRYWADAASADEIAAAEASKPVSRTDIINYCIRARNAQRYLEIGVNNPALNFDRIDCAQKTSVDPGIQYKPNPVDFPMTSDAFFDHWKREIGTPYDVIFIDGLHRADQVARDIEHALEMTPDDGLIVLHDCNPPHREFAREPFDRDGVAQGYWNGTTWKAAWSFFFNGSREFRVVDSDWGVGIIDKSKSKAPQATRNPYFEFDEFTSMKREVGYLVSWEEAKAWLGQVDVAKAGPVRDQYEERGRQAGFGEG